MYILPQSKCNMANGRHLENRYDVDVVNSCLRFGIGNIVRVYKFYLLTYLLITPPRMV